MLKVFKGIDQIARIAFVIPILLLLFTIGFIHRILLTVAIWIIEPVGAIKINY